MAVGVAMSPPAEVPQKARYVPEGQARLASSQGVTERVPALLARFGANMTRPLGAIAAPRNFQVPLTVAWRETHANAPLETS